MMNDLPGWLKRGQLVEFGFAVGEIIDVAVSPDRVMVLVTSPKGIWRNHPAEWLEYKDGALKPASRERAERDVNLYREYIVKMLADMDALESKWFDLDTGVFSELDKVTS